MVAVQNIRFLLWNFIEQRRNYNARKRRILTSIGVILKRRKGKIQKILDLLRLESFLLEHHGIQKNRQRTCRRFYRNNTNWWETVQQTYSEKRFKHTFRVSRNTFYFILSKIQHRIQKEFVVEEPISPEKRLAICLYRLGRGDYLYTIAELVGLAESTVCKIVLEVCRAIIEELWSESVDRHFPKSEQAVKEKLVDMDAEWQFPYAFAGIDGSHLPIKCPHGGQEAMKQYYNFKNFYSVVLLGLVDANYRFIWASLGAPGNTHDSTYFQSTSLWGDICSGNILPDKAVEVNGVEIPPIILGDGAFPLRSWLMKPHGDAILTSEKAYFNYRLSRARMITEGAFGKLKGRFRVLFRKCESNKETVKIMGLACVVLHNICIDRKDIIPRKFDLTFDHVTNKRRDREELRDLLDLTNTNLKNYMDKGNGNGKKVRDTITQVFWEEKNDTS